ncbi:MAG: cell division protein ZapB [Thermodesulfobacteriota bacterium]|jgi:chromosome segregation ATPase
MAGEIVLDEENGKIVPEADQGPLGNLEEKVGYLLKKYHELKKERDELAIALDAGREKMIRLEKKMELLSQDREKVKTRIDQLLYRLKSIDI